MMKHKNQQENQSNPIKGSSSLEIRSNKYHIKSKGTLITTLLILVLSLSLVLQNEELIRLVHETFDSAKDLQNEKLKAAHPEALTMIDKWNYISDMSEKGKETKYIKKNLDTTIAAYTLAVDKLSQAKQVAYFWHFAKLKIIEADVTANNKFIEEAITALKKAKKIAENTGPLSINDYNYIKDNNFLYKIKRTSLNAYALGHYNDKKKYVQKDALDILNSLDGCEGIIKEEQTKHIKILTALNCMSPKLELTQNF